MATLPLLLKFLLGGCLRVVDKWRYRSEVRQERGAAAGVGVLEEGRDCERIG